MQLYLEHYKQKKLENGDLKNHKFCKTPPTSESLQIDNKAI